MLNKYKYSLNRGLPLNQKPKKKAINIKTYALISQKTPVLYDISVTANGKSFVLYNDHEYLHRECEIVTDARPEAVLKEVQNHYRTNDNSLTIFIANEPINSDEIIMGLQEEQSLLSQTYRNLKANLRQGSEIVMSIVGVRGENTLTDELYAESLQANQYGEFQRNKPLLRLRNTENQSSKYQLEGLARKHINDERDLQQVVIRYKELKNQSQYMSLTEEKYWDWLQGQLFIMKEVALDHDGQEIAIKTHFILKINQYLHTTASLMLKLGITLRRLQERTRKGADNNESKLFKVLSNCWINASLKSIHLFLQIGHHLTLKEEYLLLVPTAEVATSVTEASRNFEELPFVYIKNYENYPKITSFLSKLNKPNDRYSSKIRSSSNQELQEERRRMRSYARDTFSSIEKKRVNNIQKEFQSQDEENKDLESIIQEAANLYKESNYESFRLSYYKRPNAEAMKKHKKMIQTLSATSKPSSEFYRSERTKEKLATRRQLTRKTTNNAFYHSTDYKPSAKKRPTHHETAYEIYTKGKKIRNVHQLSRMQQTKQYVDAMIKKEILQLEKDDQIFLYDDQSPKEVY